MITLELRQQCKKTEAITILTTSTFWEADRNAFCKKAKELNKQHPEKHHWVFAKVHNQNSTKK